MVSAGVTGRAGRREQRGHSQHADHGLPTDLPADFNAGLQALLGVPAGRDTMRMVVAIGSTARSDALTKFIGNSSLPVLVASDVEQIADQLHRASLWVTNPQIRPAGLYGDDAEPQGPAFRDISDVVL